MQVGEEERQPGQHSPQSETGSQVEKTCPHQLHPQIISHSSSDTLIVAGHHQQHNTRNHSEHRQLREDFLRVFLLLVDSGGGAGNKMSNTGPDFPSEMLNMKID